MIQRSNDRIWINFTGDTYHRMGPGFTHVEEVCKTALLETPRLSSPLCAREILYHTAWLEFEGYRNGEDPVHRHLHELYMTRGEDAAVTLILGSRTDKLTGQAMKARRVKGYVCLENPGSGEGPMGSFFKGKILFADLPEKGIYIETSQTFLPD
ncbi:MAG: hypothetical protein J6C26_05050 [Clostridia bacterium]|nr:hypothetical protein [Clostridia bacterium]